MKIKSRFKIHWKFHSISLKPAKLSSGCEATKSRQKYNRQQQARERRENIHTHFYLFIEFCTWLKCIDVSQLRLGCHSLEGYILIYFYFYFGYEISCIVALWCPNQFFIIICFCLELLENRIFFSYCRNSNVEYEEIRGLSCNYSVIIRSF